MKRAEGLIRTTPAPDAFEVYSKRASFSTAKAEAMLGYQPRFSLDEALPITAAWLAQNGFVAPQAANGGSH
jgi:nucleoside-diphosphate-sugar epimerase